MIAKAKVISHGANAIRYSVDKDKAEIVKTNLLPDDISPTAMWARMLALQKKFEDKLNRYHPLKRNMIRIEVSPTSEETRGWTMEDWQRLANDFIREFDAVDLSAKSKRKSAKATNLKDSQYVVALHRDSKSGINTDEFHHYPVDIPQDCLDIIDNNIALDADNVFAKIGDVQKTAILLFAEYIDAATTIAAQSGGGGCGATSGWGRDKDEDELSWAHRCAMMANRLCRPRKKQGYGR